MPKYKTGKPDKPWYFEPGESTRIACCDCGLVHHIKADIAPDGRIALYFVVDNRATGQMRRWLKDKNP